MGVFPFGVGYFGEYVIDESPIVTLPDDFLVGELRTEHADRSLRSEHLERRLRSEQPTRTLRFGD